MKIFVSSADSGKTRLLDTLLKTESRYAPVAADSNGDSASLINNGLSVLWLEDGPLRAARAETERQRAALPPGTPLLVIGSWKSPEDAAELVDAGADDYLASPFEAPDLLLRLRVLEARLQRHTPGWERQLLEERLGDSQKIDTLTTLAGTLAHDFNNILAAILGNAELAMLDLSANEPTRYNLEQIDKASRRAADITRQMLAYSGRSGSGLRPLNLSDLVEEMAELLRTTISKRCTIHYHFERPLPNIVGDPGQLRQVVMNLLINASEATQGKNGEIHVRTGLEQHGEETWTTLEIEDNGAGMTPETRERIFDPFFTTKRTGRGLGLAAVQGIVRAHKGEISVDSTPGKGTIFRILLPVCPESVGLITGPGLEMPDWHGTGSILLIDDEDAVREAARRMLKKAGFEVLEAASGDEGAEMFCRHAASLNAVILDLNMPGLDGFEVYEVIREVRPDMRVIVWSGVDEAAAREKLAKFGTPVILEKPTSARELAVTLKRVLSPEPEPQPQAGNGSSPMPHPHGNGDGPAPRRAEATRQPAER